MNFQISEHKSCRYDQTPICEIYELLKESDKCQRLLGKTVYLNRRSNKHTPSVRINIFISERHVLHISLSLYEVSIVIYNFEL
jgi:hypothetical protein